jgi:hypothetical protein
VKKINKIQALKIVRKNGLRLKELSSIYKKDKDVVLVAVKIDGFAIAEADKSKKIVFTKEIVFYKLNL